ncbi:MAG: aldehyde dehydrogenase family protein [Pseudobdellovibrionaceae bacterium]|nr:aldehyde dehydrogenase family protein [Pseudomonadota bacterium]
MNIVSLPQLISVLQAGKKFSQPMVRPTIEDRRQWLRRLEAVILDGKEDLLKALNEGYACSQAVSEKYFFDPVLKELRSTLLQTNENLESLYTPQGLVVALAPRVFWFQWVWHAIIQNLVAGNGLVIKPSSRTPARLNPLWSLTAETLSKFLKSDQISVLQEGAVQIVRLQESTLKEFLVQHPSVNGLMVAGGSETLSHLATLAAKGGKAYTGYGPSSNTALVLGGSESLQVAEQLAQSCFLFQGQHPYSVKKVICLDQSSKEFFELFRQAAERLFEKEAGEFFLQDHLQFAEKAIGEINQDVGQWLTKPDLSFLKTQNRLNFSVIRELPHCSVYQQEELPFPIALVSSVKYPHEMVRWVNQGELALAAQIFGEPEKARNLGAKFEVGTVWINQWYDQSSSYSMGLKATLRGQMSCHWNDEFFSRRRRFDSLP